MPKNKPQYNAFYFYMQSLKPELKRQSRSMGMQELVAYSMPRWKSLTDDEQEVFDRMAKDRKRQQRGSAKADEYRQDNQGNIIAHRSDGDIDMTKQRTRDRKMARCRWPADIVEHPFYFISFQYLCEMDDNKWMPCEVGLIEWSMEHGITKTYQRFIEPGGIPLGFRFLCQSHSDETHKIPIQNFEKSDSNYLGIYTQIENFVNPDGKKDEYPPVYCLHAGDGKEWKMVNYCLSWIHNQACTGHVNRLSKVYCLEDMVVDLYALVDQSLSDTSATTALTTTVWDYEPNTRCPYHEEIEVKYCALGTCKRYAFALSDALKTIFDFELTERHLPTQDDTGPGYTVIPAGTAPVDPQPNTDRYQGSGRDQAASNGPYGARDVRYLQNQGAGDEDDDDYEETDDTMSLRSSQSTFNGTTASSWGPPPKPAPSPWMRGALSSQSAPSVASEDDFPSLGAPSISSRDDYSSIAGGDTGARIKYAGRAAAPHPSELPSPAGWQAPTPAYDPRPVPRPVTRPVAPQPTNQKPTIHQAVQHQQPVPVAQTQPRPVRPAMPAGRGVRLPASSRVVNSAGFNPMQTDPTQRFISTDPLTAHGGSSGRPTLSQSVQRENVQQPNKSADPTLAGRGTGSTSSQPGSYPSSSPAQPQGVTSVPGPPQPLVGLGRGRGRGIYSGATRQAGGGSGMAAPPGVMKPPPGFGRGLNQQMASMSMDGRK